MASIEASIDIPQPPEVVGRCPAARDTCRVDDDITYVHDGNESVFRLTLPACG
ncbi:MAG: hypothetical protein GY926_16695 [bacterium]|nr:hypothetical protein [bacterium]MCP4966854.1 hypothetical protein [bacterium]